VQDYNNYSNEELIKLIKQLESELEHKKYGLVWDREREPEKVVLECQNNLPILTENKNKHIKTDNSDDNILIEGDNYHALSVLNYTHANKIDVIYIDPPYNTGQKDFIYNDRFVDKEDKYRHSMWLNFMEKRLNLAKNLLTKDGVIFCSIDDNEYPRLIMLFEKIFGEQNTKTIVVKMSEASGLKMGSVLKQGTIPKLKEYLVIAKVDGIKNLYFEKIPKETWDQEYNIFLENFTKEEKLIIDEISSKKSITQEDIELLDNIAQNIQMVSVSKKLKELKISSKDKEQWLFENAYRIVRTTASSTVHTLAKKKKQYCNNELFFVLSVKGLLYFVKSTFSDTSKKPRVQMIFAEDNLTQHPGDFWADIKTTGLDNEGNVDFKNGKKPIKLIERILKSIHKDSFTVLDFFAGSGTTGEVVLKLKAQLKKDIKFILCTTNDDKEKICDNVTYPRLQYAIDNYGGNLKYFKASLLPKSSSYTQTKLDLVSECTFMLCVKEGIYDLLLEKEDYNFFISNDKTKVLAIYYNIEDDSLQEFLDELRKIKQQKFVYMFSDSDEVDKTIFREIKGCIINAIPQKILNVYKQLNKQNIAPKSNTIVLDLQKAKRRIFEEKDKDDGASKLRVVLEQVLETIAYQYGLNLNDFNSISRLNTKLKDIEVFNKVIWKANETYLTIGNDASHGDYDNYDIQQVKAFYEHIRSIIEQFKIGQ
jgi:adenine-specific DNA-methyltransferase